MNVLATELVSQLDEDDNLENITNDDSANQLPFGYEFK
jgi:hypothetical protein